MKTLLLVAATLSMSSAFAKPVKADACTLYVSDPVITHTVYGRNNGGNGVNAGVLKILQNNGFTISTNPSTAKYVMDTEVRCGQQMIFFMLQDACQTEIKITNNKEEKIAYTDGPTAPLAGLNIDFNNINFPKCSDL